MNTTTTTNYELHQVPLVTPHKDERLTIHHTVHAYQGSYGSGFALVMDAVDAEALARTILETVKGMRRAKVGACKECGGRLDHRGFCGGCKYIDHDLVDTLERERRKNDRDERERLDAEQHETATIEGVGVVPRSHLSEPRGRVDYNRGNGDESANGMSYADGESLGHEYR